MIFAGYVPLNRGLIEHTMNHRLTNNEALVFEYLLTDKRTRRYLVADELETQVWRDVAYAMDAILSSDEPIREQLHWKGYWAAMAWKSERIYKRKQGRGEKYFIGMNGVETIVKNDDGEEEELEVAVESVMDLNADLNPIIIERVPWTEAAFNYEVRRVFRANRAGLFRADDVYGDAENAEQYLAAVA